MTALDASYGGRCRLCVAFSVQYDLVGRPSSEHRERDPLPPRAGLHGAGAQPASMSDVVKRLSGQEGG